MCTLAVFRRNSAHYPLVVAANRDEFYARASAPPARREDLPSVVAGRDLEAGGTWLGCVVDGEPLVAGLLNRRSADPDVAGVRGEISRGLLCVEALRNSSVEGAVAALRDIPAMRYGPFNLLIADLDHAVVLDNHNGLRTTRLGEGLSLLTNLDVNDPRCPRLASATAPFEGVARLLASGADVEEVVAACATVLASHHNSLDPTDTNPLARLCVHTELYGTRSSSLIFVGRDRRVRYFHAAGPPCRTDLRELDVASGHLSHC